MQELPLGGFEAPSAIFSGKGRRRDFALLKLRYTSYGTEKGKTILAVLSHVRFQCPTVAAVGMVDLHKVTSTHLEHTPGATATSSIFSPSSHTFIRKSEETISSSPPSRVTGRYLWGPLFALGIELNCACQWRGERCSTSIGCIVTPRPVFKRPAGGQPHFPHLVWAPTS